MKHYSIKAPTTYKEQVEILKSRNIVIPDTEYAERVLSFVNYYRFTGIILPFKDTSRNVYNDLDFRKAYSLYEFDRKLRNLLLLAIEPIEIALRTRLAYQHTHKYGPLGYLNFKTFNKYIFNNPQKHAEFIKSLNDKLSKNYKFLIIKHHNKKYGGQFPLWVALEFSTFGMISKLYSMLKNKEKKKIATQYDQSPDNIGSWLHCLTVLRNFSAHQNRIYGQDFIIKPKEISRTIDYPNLVFGQILALEKMHPNKPTFISEFVIPLISLVDEYSGDINLDHIGFPEDWASYFVE